VPKNGEERESENERERERKRKRRLLIDPANKVKSKWTGSGD
jgi:hypothetical protein